MLIPPLRMPSPPLFLTKLVLARVLRDRLRIFPVRRLRRNRLARGDQLIVCQTLKVPPESLGIEESVIHPHDFAF
jgi:hypothetical protein